MHPSQGGKKWGWGGTFPTYWPCEKDIQLVTTVLNRSPCQRFSGNNDVVLQMSGV